MDAGDSHWISVWSVAQARISWAQFAAGSGPVNHCLARTIKSFQDRKGNLACKGNSGERRTIANIWASEQQSLQRLEIKAYLGLNQQMSDKRLVSVPRAAPGHLGFLPQIPRHKTIDFECQTLCIVNSIDSLVYGTDRKLIKLRYPENGQGNEGDGHPNSGLP